MWLVLYVLTPVVQAVWCETSHLASTSSFTKVAFDFSLKLGGFGFVLVFIIFCTH